MHLQCHSCATTYPPTTVFRCRECDQPFHPVYDTQLDPARIAAGDSLFEKYDNRLPSDGTLAGDEGDTPLLRARELEATLGIEATVYLKDERRNPTGSFKDRAYAPALSLAAESGHDAVLTASTGNAAAACARYAARGELDCHLLVDDEVPAGKLTEPSVYGADVVRVTDLFAGGRETQERVLGAVAERLDAYLAFAFHPVNAVVGEGIKTISYEVVEQLDSAPDVVMTATGGGDNLAAQYRGYRELAEAGIVDETPRMVAAQAAGAAPLVEAVERGASTPTAVDNPDTIASGIDAPFAGQHGLDAIRDSEGTAVGIADEAIVDAVTTLARTEAVWAEPASATVVPVLAELGERGIVGAADTVVLTITGSGHKHTEPVKQSLPTIPTVECDPGTIADAVGE